MTDRAWSGTGHTVKVDGWVDRIPEFDPRSGDHLWVIVTAHRIDPKKMQDPTHTPFLDTESLLNVSGPGCYYCEQEFTPLIASRRCRGHA